MPIWLRKFTFESLKKYYQEKREAEEEAYSKSKGIEKAVPSIARPNIKPPTYSTKVPKN